jgi:peptidoglycan/LPS O-acetylase OafA/YrhL
MIIVFAEDRLLPWPIVMGVGKFKSPTNLQPEPRRWIAIAALVLVVIVAISVWRFFSRN